MSVMHVSKRWNWMVGGGLIEPARILPEYIYNAQPLVTHTMSPELASPICMHYEQLFCSSINHSPNFGYMIA